MKLDELKTWGHAGIKVTLNIMDQFEITHMVERIESYFETKKEFEERDNFENLENGLVPIPVIDEELKMVLIFLKKLALSENLEPTVFEEQKEEPKKEAE